MKKIYFIFATLIILSIACTKEENKIASTENDKGVREYLSVDPTEAKIQKFINRMDLVREDPNYSGSENWNYSQDSAVWYVEAALNYQLSKSYKITSENEYYYTGDIDSLFVESENFSETNNNITTLQIMYDYIYENISSIVENHENNPFFLFADLIPLDTKEFDVVFLVGNKTSLYSIGSWYWGWALGQCSGGNQGVDAADIIEMYANSTLPPYPTASSPFSYYTNVSSTQKIFPPDVSTSQNPYGNYMLFHDYQTITLNHHCLNTPELGTFLSFMPNIASIYKPANKVLLHYEVQDDFAAGLTPTGDDFWDMIHWTVISYGIHHTGYNTNNQSN